MATARLESEWDRTAQTLAIMAEINRDRKKRSKPFTADDFHPYKSRSARRSEAIEKTDIQALKVFLHGSK